MTVDAAFLARCRARLALSDPIAVEGRVCALVGTLLEGEGMPARVGSVCRIHPDGGGAPRDGGGAPRAGSAARGGAGEPILAEVVGFRDDRFLLMPLDGRSEVGPGARIRLERLRPEVPAGEACLGRVLNALGEPIDGGPPLDGAVHAPLYGRAQPALTRERIRKVLDVGVRAIDAFTPLGRGARIGLFAGSGVGKSTLLGQIARQASADVIVVGLVGERGREVREFIERELGPARSRAVVVVATSDEAALRRVRAAHAATAIAERFREEGRDVLLLIDSITRVCTALREVGLAAGEPPTTRGYTPSVWSELPRLLERAGTAVGSGNITGVYSVLVEGDDPNEPVADAARAILDGHIALTRELAERGHFPAIDVLASVSRVMPDVATEAHRDLAARARAHLATYRRVEDLISIGAYAEGSDPAVDEARRLHEPLVQFLAQRPDDCTRLPETLEALAAVLDASPSAEAA